MPARYGRGQLVEVATSSGPTDTPEEYRWEPDSYDGPMDVKGLKGQLLEWNEGTSKWIVRMFNTFIAAVSESDLRPLSPEDVEGFDIALGSASSASALGQELVHGLTRKGHVICRTFVSPKDLAGMVAAADRAVEESCFTRLPNELEPGYLGVDGQGKTMTLDFEDNDTLDYLKESPIQLSEEHFQCVSAYLSPYALDELGFELYTRSQTMMVMPYDGDEDAYPRTDLQNAEAAAYLSTMWRAKLQIIYNAGPGDATLTLLPNARCSSSDQAETRCKMEPGMLAVVAMDRYKFKYEPRGKSLMLSTWLLAQPRELIIDTITGDRDWIMGAGSGPPMPKNDLKEQIPVVSMATRYAFGVDEPWKLWIAYAKANYDTMIRHPPNRWDCDQYYEPNADQLSGKSYTCHGGFSDGIELFDAKFFDISPAEAKTMDPTQRQVLEVSYIALMGTGHTKKQLQAKSAQVAMFVGLDKNEWSQVPKDACGGFGASSNANAICANRFNYCMNLKGASMTIDTACSGSLVCCHTGKLYLMYKHYDKVDAVIACGVNLSLIPQTYVGSCAAGMHSHIGRCFTYNASADGFARGESTAACGLKAKQFEASQGDLAILAGSHVNQDGRSASMMAPNGPSQERCNMAVLKEVGLKPSEVDATESHGTGTSLGDPIEIGAYRKVMGFRDAPVVITASKTNVGHCEGSAGIGGFFKAILMCIYAEGTPNCHFNRLNPHLDMDGFPGAISTEGLSFQGQDASYTGVMSFGYGGTNATALCWGRNTQTSRTSCGDIYDAINKRVLDAPPQDVTITGEDWEDWEIDGPGPHAAIGESWDIEFEEDNRTVTYYRKERSSTEDYGSSYYLTGSFNSWGFELMEPVVGVTGLYEATITIGNSLEEHFQIVADKEPHQTFYPDIPNCALKSAEVKGPDEVSRDYSWKIIGDVADRWRVELFRSERGLLVTWVREK